MSQKVASANIKIKRAYERRSPDDGPRILIDRLWPRGISKIDAAINHWARHRAQHDVAKMVRARSRPLAGISLPLRRGGSRASSTNSADYVPWHDRVRSHWCILRMTRFITTPLR